MLGPLDWIWLAAVAGQWLALETDMVGGPSRTSVRLLRLDMVGGPSRPRVRPLRWDMVGSPSRKRVSP